MQTKGNEKGSGMHKVLIVYGTRPEAIKVAPLIREIDRSSHCTSVVAVTGQHREMLDQVNKLFAIRPAYDLNVIRERQSLEDITSRVLEGVSKVIDIERPDAVVVQGDTTTCFAAALSAFYHKVSLVHLEAGLRTGDPKNPFPEEVNRRLTTQMAALHLAPTQTSKKNLLHDGIDERSIVVTGNTVIDALIYIAGRRTKIGNPDLRKISGKRCVLITAHRRESWGEPMERATRAVASLAKAFPQILFLLPAHLNPAVREVLLPPLLGLQNVMVTPPLDYGDFVRAMRNCSIVLTDSGGVQEEAPAFGKPVLVMRETTERPEAVAAGTAKLVGTDEDLIICETTRLLTDRKAYQAMARAVNPYGDGQAAARSLRAIEHFFGIGALPAEFGAGEGLLPAASAPSAARVINDFAA
jgi:UDP-N-acetylglucosamine 2-epimerase (non-hydrolysing)